MSIEATMKASLEAQVRQAEALEGIYSCLQVLTKLLAEPRVTIDQQIVAPAAEEEEQPAKPARGSRRQQKNQDRPATEDPKA